MDEISKEIGRYEVVNETKVNCEKLVGLRLGSWKSCTLLGPFSSTDGLSKIFGV